MADIVSATVGVLQLLVDELNKLITACVIIQNDKAEMAARLSVMFNMTMPALTALINQYQAVGQTSPAVYYALWQARTVTATIYQYLSDSYLQERIYIHRVNGVWYVQFYDKVGLKYVLKSLRDMIKEYMAAFKELAEKLDANLKRTTHLMAMFDVGKGYISTALNVSVPSILTTGVVIDFEPAKFNTETAKNINLFTLKSYNDLKTIADQAIQHRDKLRAANPEFYQALDAAEAKVGEANETADGNIAKARTNVKLALERTKADPLASLQDDSHHDKSPAGLPSAVPTNVVLDPPSLPPGSTGGFVPPDTTE